MLPVGNRNAACASLHQPATVTMSRVDMPCWILALLALAQPPQAQLCPAGPLQGSPVAEGG